MRRAATVVLLGVLLVACRPATDGDAATPTEEPSNVAVLPPVEPSAAGPTPPTATDGLPSPSASSMAPSSVAPSSVAPTTTPPPATPPPPPALPPGEDPLPDVPTDPAEFGQTLGVAGLIDLLDSDPSRAGERGEDLLEELERVLDKPDDKRIRRATGRVETWLDDGELDQEVGQAVLAALAATPVDDDDE